MAAGAKHADCAGTVRDIVCNVGDQVEMGERIMRVEEERATGKRSPPRPL